MCKNTCFKGTFHSWTGHEWLFLQKIIDKAGWTQRWCLSSEYWNADVLWTLFVVQWLIFFCPPLSWIMILTTVQNIFHVQIISTIDFLLINNVLFSPIFCIFSVWPPKIILSDFGHFCKDVIHRIKWDVLAVDWWITFLLRYQPDQDRVLSLKIPS